MIVLKLFHLLFLFMWIGTLLALSRLLAYLPREEEKMRQKMVHMYRRMYLFIDLPSMVLALGFGIAYFIFKGVDMKQGWLHMKLTFVFFLVLCDVWLGRSLLKRERMMGSKKFKIIHTLSALSLVAILVSVYVIKTIE